MMTITATDIPAEFVEQGFVFNDPGPFGAGPSIHFSDAMLPELCAVMGRVVILGSPRRAARSEAKMEKDQFATLFHEHLTKAVRLAQTKVGRALPDKLIIELHGASFAGKEMSPSETLDVLYLGSEKFYRIVDISVLSASESTTRVFVRVSDHPPGAFEETWNDPPGSGPFKVLEPIRIRLEE